MTDEQKRHDDELIATFENGNKSDLKAAIQDMTPLEAARFGCYVGVVTKDNLLDALWASLAHWRTDETGG